MPISMNTREKSKFSTARYLHVTVKDTGEGMSKEGIKKLFKEFGMLEAQGKIFKPNYENVSIFLDWFNLKL